MILIFYSTEDVRFTIYEHGHHIRVSKSLFRVCNPHASIKDLGKYRLGSYENLKRNKMD